MSSPTDSKGLADTLDIALRDVPFYKRLWHDATAAVPESTPPIEQWPTWSVHDLRAAIAANPPYGDLYQPHALDDLSYIHSSTGTTGKPRIFPVPRMDMAEMRRFYGETFERFGIGPGDIVAITSTFGMPRGAWSCLQATEAVGATVVPASNGKVTPPEKLFDVIEAVGATALQANGSYLVHLAKRAAEFGVDLKKLKVRTLISNGEAMSTESRRFVEAEWDARVVMNFASTDLSWVSAECSHSSARAGELGMHVSSCVYAEVLDENQNPVPDGEYGELVITSWLRPSTPRIRFRTGDRAAITNEVCECGDTATRILPIQGRVDEAVRYHGQTIWAAAVEDVLGTYFGHPVDFYMEHRPSPEKGSVLALKLPESLRGAVDAELEPTLQKRLNVRFTVELMADDELIIATGVSTGGKAKRVVDHVSGGAK